MTHLEKIEKTDREMRKEMEMHQPVRYFQEKGKATICAEWNDKNPTLIWKNGSFIC